MKAFHALEFSTFLFSFLEVLSFVFEEKDFTFTFSYGRFAFEILTVAPFNFGVENVYLYLFIMIPVNRGGKMNECIYVLGHSQPTQCTSHF